MQKNEHTPQPAETKPGEAADAPLSKKESPARLEIATQKTEVHLYSYPSASSHPDSDLFRDFEQNPTLGFADF